MQRHKWLPRITGMTGLEVLTRARQGFMKRWDYMIPADLRKTLRDGDPESIRTARFFFDPSELRPIIELMRQLMPEQAVLIQEHSEQICQHRFALLGYENLDYGPKIDWHLDVVNGKRAPRKAWFKVPYLNFGEVGDHKVIWELNRHQHLVTLAKAYCLTGEPRYVEELCAQWYDWNKENPYAIGINWSSSLEVGFRTLSWLWVRQLLRDCAVLPSNFQSDLVVGLTQNARHISRYLSTYFSPNTHLLGEAVALFFVGTLCPEIRRAPEWETIGWEILVREAERQVQADGVYFEQSIYYHVYALDLFLHARILADRNGRLIPSGFDCKIEQMAEVLSALGQSGTPPRVGDDDGGRVFDPRRNGAVHLCDPLSTAAALFGRADFKAVSPSLREETLWLLGEDGAAKFAKLPVINPKLISRGFESSGFYVMASEAPRTQLVARAGQMGALRAGHSHCDLLSLNLSINDQQCLTDPGTFRYVSETGERNDFRGTSAHNTVRVDGCDQAEAGDSFSWVSLPTVRVQHWIQGHTVDVLAAEHSGYRRLASPATHGRWVVHLKDQFWFVRDLVGGEGRHLLEVYWHLAPGLVWKEETAASFLASRSLDASCSLTLFSTDGHHGSGNIRSGWYSPAYGVKTEVSVLEFSTLADVPSEFATVLFPGRASAAHLAALPSTHGKGQCATVVGYRFEESGESHFFFFATSGESWAWQGWSSDAGFLYGRTDGNNELIRLVLCNGSFAETNGRRLFDSRKVVSRYEWLGSAGEPNVWCSDPEIEPNARLSTPPVANETISGPGPLRGSG
jgi:Heparinase II/III-like protein/Heparinase II/III N-terminus